MSCDYRFDILIRTLYVSKNLIMVYLIVKFLFKFLYSLDDDVIEDVIREFFESRVGERKVKKLWDKWRWEYKKNYIKEDCTYEAVKNQLKKFEHPLASDG